MAMQKKCEICGKLFMANSPSQKICGSEECLREQENFYRKSSAEICSKFCAEYRNKPEVKKYKNDSGKQYQIEHKDQTEEYKKNWYKKQQFFKYLKKGILLKNMYWFSLTKEQKVEILSENKIVDIKVVENANLNYQEEIENNENIANETTTELEKIIEEYNELVKAYNDVVSELQAYRIADAYDILVEDAADMLADYTFEEVCDALDRCEAKEAELNDSNE